MAELSEDFDLAALLAPVPGDAPAGMDLREDLSPTSRYTRLRDARAEARAAERAMDAEDAASASPPQWRTIRDLATEAVAGYSKDLEVATWLTEALLRSDGLAGLSAGLRLMTGLIEQYWDDLFPLPDEDGMATRVAPVAGLNGQSGEGTLMQPLRKLALFARPDGTPLQLWQFQQSTELAGIADATRRQQRIDAGIVPFDTLENEARAVGGDHFTALRRDATEAAEAWRALSDTLDSKVGAEAPATSRVRDILEEIRNVGDRFAAPGTATAADDNPSAAVATDAAPVEPGGPIAAAVPGAINSRTDALRSLAAVAGYFRRAEPLSPLAYTLEEVVRRSAMTWPQLLEEIVPDAATRAAILSSLGIRPPPSV
jgi:type VI secretion system protein ImpA